VGEPAGAAVVGDWLLVCGPSVIAPTVPVVAAEPEAALLLAAQKVQILFWRPKPAVLPSRLG
jgi:hypothetical protein